MTEVDPRALRDAFGAFMTGVTVVTTHDQDGNPLGFTANSFTSVSLDPPLVLVCLANSSSNYEAFQNASGFAVNILSETQKDVSNTFARPVEDRFSCVSWEKGPAGSPVFEDVSAWFDCAIFNRVEAGDHLILIGKVEAFENFVHAGLGYARGAYVTPSAEIEALKASANQRVTALVAHEGRVLLVDDGTGKLGLPEAPVGKDGASGALGRLIEATGATAEPGFIYSIYEDEARDTQHVCFMCHADSDVASHGKFVELSPSTLMDVADPAVCTMLERFAAESRMGNFGFYFGNQVSGKVRPLASGRQQ